MARTKTKPDPLLAHKHAFIDSLDAMMGEAMMLINALDMVLKNDTGIKLNVANLLRERLNAFRKTIFTEN